MFTGRVVNGAIVPIRDEDDEDDLGLQEGEVVTVFRADHRDEWTEESLDPELRASLNRGLEQLERGEGIPDAEARAMLEEHRLKLAANPKKRR